MSPVAALRTTPKHGTTQKRQTQVVNMFDQCRAVLVEVFNRAWRPRIGATLAVGIGVLMSLAPGLLPRTTGTQAIVTGVLAACALGIAGVGRYILRRWDIDLNRRLARYRGPLVAATAALIVGAVLHADHWQNRLRAAMDAPAIGPDYWLRSAIGAVLLVGVVFGITRALRWALRRLGRVRGIAVGAVAVVMTTFLGVPAAVDWRGSAYASANAAFDPTLVQPVSSLRSGSTASAVSWSALGAEGRKFVTGTPGGPIRVYVGMDAAADLDSRVELAIRELERSGGLTRSHIVVTVPTGSGWIDDNAVRGFSERFGDDAALVGMQYSYAPSWVTFLFGRDDAVTAARALFTAVEQRIGAMADPPKLYLYGQSLGALGGSAVFDSAADQDRRTCAALWAGPPGGEVHHGSATILANSSDPVVHWSPALLWRAPDLADVRIDAPIPPWLPVVSFIQVSADLLAALDAPPGHGHRYGTDQGTAIGSC